MPPIEIQIINGSSFMETSQLPSSLSTFLPSQSFSPLPSPPPLHGFEEMLEMSEMEAGITSGSASSLSPSLNNIVSPNFLQTNETAYRVFIKNPADMIDPWHSNADFMTIILTHAITFIVGVIGNSVVIATWAKGGKIRSPTATFLVSLACADLLLLIIFMPLETLEYFVITWDQHGHICKLSSFVELLSGMSSILNLVAVSVERFLVIVYPIQARRWCTVTKSRRSLVLVWVLAIIFAAPPVFNKSTYSMTYFNNETSITAFYCFEKSDHWAMFFAIYELMTLFVIPATLMIFCYFRVIRELWTSTRVITILTSANAGQYRQTTSTSTLNNSCTVTAAGVNGVTGVCGQPVETTSASRSYLVRWPGRKPIVSGSVINGGGESNEIVHLQTKMPPSKKKDERKSSVTSSGVSSSSTSAKAKANKKASSAVISPEVSEVIENGISLPIGAPPDSPAGGSTSSSQCAGAAKSPSRLSKLYYCIHNLRTLLWLRPSYCSTCCRNKRKRKKVIGHRGHHRCHHHHHHHNPHNHNHNFKSARGHHHHHQSNSNALNGTMSYQQIKSCCCCLYQNSGAHCTTCISANKDLSSINNGKNNSTVAQIETEKLSSTCSTSGTCGAPNSSTNLSNVVNGSKRASDSSNQSHPPLPPHQEPNLFRMFFQQVFWHFCFCSFCCSCFQQQKRRKPTSFPRKYDGSLYGGDNYKMESPFEMRKAMQSFAASPVVFTGGDHQSGGDKLRENGNTLKTPSLINHHHNHHHHSYNMLTVHGSSTPKPPAIQTYQYNQSVTSMALPATITTAGSGSCPNVYHHSTTSAYRAPVTDVRNARKQLYCQVIKMLLFIVILFHVCWGPRLIFNVIKSAGIASFSNLAYNARVYFYLLSFAHSALNPFVYSMCSANFRRMMLNSCNHHRHHHHHRHQHYDDQQPDTTDHNHHRHDKHLCPGPGTQVNSLVDAVNSTNCLNMVHLKASFSLPKTHLNNSVTSENLEQPRHSSSSGNKHQNARCSSSSSSNHHQNKGAHCSQTPVSVYYEDQQQRKVNSSTESEKHDKIVSDDEDEEETSYGDIQAELQQALDSMQQEQHLRKSSSGRQLSTEASKSTSFFEKVESLLFLGSRSGTAKKKRKTKGGSLPPSMNRSSSVSFFERGGSGNGDNSVREAADIVPVKSHTGGHNSKKSSAGGSRVSLTSEKRPPKLSSKQNAKM